MDKRAYVCPYLEFYAVSNGEETYSLKFYELNIYNSGKESFIFRGDTKPSKETKPFILEAGKYIISVSRFKDIEELNSLGLGLHEYTLRIEAQEF